ncbi:MAG: ArsI/CadI family heavy metal resistance metalloenzyme [Burkholderiaceae bacterium]
MKRFHVHVAVDNLADSIRFYSAMFSTEPSVQKSDYAKWMLDDPHVNFAISQRGAQTGLNHLGIQVESDAELVHMQSRLESLQPGVEKEEGVACCYAKSDKYWVTDPSGIAWETFHSLETIPVFGEEHRDENAQSSCCIPLTKSSSKADAPCCVTTGNAKAQGSSCC